MESKTDSNNVRNINGFMFHVLIFFFILSSTLSNTTTILKFENLEGLNQKGLEIEKYVHLTVIMILASDNINTKNQVLNKA